MHYSMWSKHGGKWRDRRREKHCHFSFSWIACVAWRFCRAGRTSGVFQVAPAPISSRFLYPRPPLLLSAPNQNRHATQAISWMKTTTQTWGLKLKSNDFQSYPREKQQLMEEKHADSIRKVLCKSFIQWFWELNLRSFKYWVDCFDLLRLSVFFCCCWSTLKWKFRNITKHFKSGPSGNQLVLFSLESWCRPRRTSGLYKENKTNCFPWDLTSSV